jgi:hypothetical protein
LRNSSRNSFGRADDRVLDHLQGDPSGGDGRLAAGLEHAQRFDHAVAAFGRDGALAGKRCMGRVLRVKIIVFPALAAIMLVRRRDLKDFDAGLLHVTQQSCTVGAGRLNTDTLERSEAAHPGKHLLVAVPGCRKALACQHPIQLIDNCRDMKILVRIDAADDTTGRPLLITFHTGSPGLAKS